MLRLLCFPAPSCNTLRLFVSVLRDPCLLRFCLSVVCYSAQFVYDRCFAFSVPIESSYAVLASLASWFVRSVAFARRLSRELAYAHFFAARALQRNHLIVLVCNIAGRGNRLHRHGCPRKLFFCGVGFLKACDQQLFRKSGSGDPPFPCNDSISV